jgi:hypothetical protein
MKRFTTGLIIFVFIACSINVKAQIGINNSDPDPSAILDIQHDSKGVLFPRILKSTFLDPPGEDGAGMFFYATEDNKFYFYNGTIWQCVNPLNSTSPNNARLNGDLEIQGNLDVEPESTISGYGTIPIGGIIMWSGEHDDIPDGWALCNGDIANTIQTPDLRGRFVVGHSMGTRATNDPRYTGVGNKNAAVSIEYNYVGNIGGDTVVSLQDGNIPQHLHESGSLSTQNAGAHSHLYSGYRAVDDGGGEQVKSRTRIDADPDDYGGESAGIHNHTVSGSTKVWGGAWQDAVYEYDYTGSPCQYLISEPNCTDKHPYTNFAMESDDCGNFIPLINAVKAAKAIVPIPNPNFFGSKTECKNPDYNSAYGVGTLITAAHQGVDPVSTRPPYYVIAFIIRVK